MELLFQEAQLPPAATHTPSDEVLAMTWVILCANYHKPLLLTVLLQYQDQFMNTVHALAAYLDAIVIFADQELWRAMKNNNGDVRLGLQSPETNGSH